MCILVLIDLVARVLALVPPWTRVYRVQRDIPMPLVTSGVEHGNLRELAHARMKELGLRYKLYFARESQILVLKIILIRGNNKEYRSYHMIHMVHII